MKRTLLGFALLGCVLVLQGDGLTSTYQQAAQAYLNAAAQCSGPGSACYSQWAQYYTCVANSLSGGGNCTQPTCTPGCQSSGGSLSGLGGLSSTASPQSVKAQQVQSLVSTGLGLLQQLMQARAQRKALEQQAMQDRQSQELQAKLDAARQLEQRLEQEAGALLGEANGALSDSQQILQTQIPCSIDFTKSPIEVKYCPETRIPSSIDFNTGEVHYDSSTGIPSALQFGDSGPYSATPTPDSTGQGRGGIPVTGSGNAQGGGNPGPSGSGGNNGSQSTPTLDQLVNSLSIGTADPR